MAKIGIKKIYGRKKSLVKPCYCAGFTLMEIVISIAILAVVIGVIVVLLADVASFGTFMAQGLATQQEINQTFQSMIPEVRSINPSNIGSYPIEQASADSFIFYSDYDGDGLFERIRYFISGDILKRGIIEPSGNPLLYNPANEQVDDMVKNLIPGAAVFAYYDQNYSGAESQMTDPLDISAIRVIRVTISAKDKAQNVPLTQTLFLTPRNLRSNI